MAQTTAQTRPVIGQNHHTAVYKVAAGQQLFVGCGVVINVVGANAGYAAKASNSANAVKTVGVCMGATGKGAIEGQSVAAPAANGGAEVLVQMGRFGGWRNSQANPVTQAHVGRVVFWEDENTVAIDTTNKRQAGRVIAIDSSGVYLDLSATAETATA